MSGLDTVLRWLWANFGTLLLAFVLAVTVWVVAVNVEDPVQERAFPLPVPIEILSPSSGLVIVGEIPTQASVVVRAPESIWRQLRAPDIVLRADLTSLGAGTHVVEIEGTIDRRPARVTSIDPDRLMVRIEPLATAALTVRVVQFGEPAVGFVLADIQTMPLRALVSGPASSVARVVELQARIDVSGRAQDVEQEVSLVPVDENGEVVSGVTIAPATVTLSLQIDQLGGYRSVAVIPRIEGQVAPGYRVENITVSPTLVTVFSSDPQKIDLLPGFVETEVINLTGATASIERRLALSLPADLSLVGDQGVLVNVSIVPIESSITLTRALEFQGLGTGLAARASPASVSVILTGPVPLLDQLRPEDVRVIVDLFGLRIGVHQATPQVINLPTSLTVETILPDVIEVTIELAPTPTPRPSP